MEHLWAPWRMTYIEKIESPGECFLCAAARDAAGDARTLVAHRAPHCICVLNRFPYNTGHLLLAPVRHVGRPGDLSDDEGLALHRLMDLSLRALEEAMCPHGFNIGVNLGRSAGAGLPGHLHWHVVPRWDGDTNFMPVLGEVKVIPQALEDTWRRLAAAFARLAGPAAPGQGA